MPHANQPVAVRHPEAPGVMVVLDPAVDYADDDVFVKAYPAFFVQRESVGEFVESVTIEAATAAPGEKRSRSRK